MRHIPTSPGHLTGSPEGVFASKYEWLLRWAMHFSQNDRTVAEDLIQETFLKLLTSWKTVKDLDNVEPLLYTYLKYSYLTELRRNQSYSLQSLSALDFDSLPAHLWTAGLSDQIELQDQLRRIVAFLLWRKSSAKFANVFLLRFFHGYFPEEIMHICMITRHAVDLSLSHARGEIKAYLADPNRIQVLHQTPPPEAVLPDAPVSPHQFVDEMRGLILSARTEACLPFVELQKLYRSELPKPIDIGLLAHIVSCESCLDRVSRFCNLPPGSKRSPWDSLGNAPRSKSSNKRSGGGSGQEVKRAIESGHRRLQEIFEHRPHGLMIALNGQVVAVRDISSPRGVLKIETHSVASLELIEVISDNGLTLLTLPVLNRPPQAPPTVTHDVQLSCGRRVSLLLSYMADGAVIEVVYEETSFVDERAQSTLAAVRQGQKDISKSGGDNEPAHKASSGKDGIQQRSGWLRLFRRRPLFSLGSLFPTAGFATLLAILTAVSLHWLNAGRHGSPMPAPDFLANAVKANNSDSVRGTAAVVHQTVKVQTATRTIHRDLYRDVQARRHPKEQPLDQEERRLKGRLYEAAVDWNDPLSATGYQTWRGHLSHPKDVVEPSGNNLLTLTTKSTEGLVLQESLTVRASDFHPVERTVQFDNHEVVEIAELAYEVVPWSPAVDTLFEAIVPPHQVATDISSPLLHSRVLAATPAELDEAELRSLLALRQLHADTERIEIVRTPKDIQVQGVVDTDERKRQIGLQLGSIPHVTLGISSYRELDNRPSARSEIHSLASVSVNAQPGPIEKYCEEKGLDKDECRKISYDLLNSSTVIRQESRKIADLLTEFSSKRSLTLTAQSLLSELILQHGSGLDTAIQQQQRALAMCGFTMSVGGQNVTEFNAANLIAVAQHNVDLAKELTYAGDNHSRPAESILADLIRSAEEIRTVASGIPEAQHHASVSSSHDRANRQ